MASKYEYISTGNGYNVKKSDGSIVQVINQDAQIIAEIADALAEGSIYIGDAAGVTSEVDFKTDGQIGVGDGTTFNSVAVSGAITLDNAGLTALATDAVSLDNLDAGITPSHIVVFAGEYTWTGGGASAAETVTGALATDIVVATIQSAPTEAAYIASCAVTADTVTTTLSAANTSNDAVIAYQVIRAAA